MNISRRSVLSGVTRTLNLPITVNQLGAYMSGATLQEAFPHLSPDQREFIYTGITAEEWERFFPMDEEDEEEERT